MKGLAADGHDFIDDALDRGAVAVVAQHPSPAARPSSPYPTPAARWPNWRPPFTATPRGR
ncbi:MAG: Mur ligase domain-containing protein [Desulfobacterales bacterium]|nr:Mur ligase domain-containing protein [Desulfobacterales bacterium]